jgi:hypothetical protein
MRKGGRGVIRLTGLEAMEEFSEQLVEKVTLRTYVPIARAAARLIVRSADEVVS